MSDLLSVRELRRETQAAVSRLEVCDYCARVTEDTEVYAVATCIRMRLCAGCAEAYRRRGIETPILRPAPPIVSGKSD